MFRAALLFSCLVLLRLPNAGAQATSASGSNQNAASLPLSIPFDFFSNQIMIKVTVNGSEPVWFILDSGASGCVVDTALAQKLGIKTEGEKQGTGAGKGTVRVLFAQHVTYGLPGLSLRVDESYVIDLSSQPALLGRYVGGVLGYSFFAPYVVDVDYDARILTLYDPESYEPVGRKVPFTLFKHTPHIRVRLVVGGHRAVEREVLVDSGSQGAVDDELLAQSRERLEVIGGVGLGQEFRTVLGRADTLSLDSFTLPRPFGATGGTGLIGNEVLRRFHVAFDYAHARIFLSPGQHFSDPFLFDASGLDLRCVSEGAAFVIHDVAKASAAWEAGLRAEDTVIAINGQPASAFTIDQLAALFSQDGRVLWLTVKKDADTRSIRLTLRKRL
ncbi:MAG TPA: aspartyl protease family protein [Candidatus Acidoferrum sp.]|nr:aspartyl protease family protein [Candidatus Acidoferrum sp.]